jgi:hypothetical protein
MPMVEIYVLQSDLDAAGRIADKMFPGSSHITGRHVMATAAQRGMALLRTEWNDTDDQANAKEVT